MVDAVDQAHPEQGAEPGVALVVAARRLDRRRDRRLPLRLGDLTPQLDPLQGPRGRERQRDLDLPLGRVLRHVRRRENTRGGSSTLGRAKVTCRLGPRRWFHPSAFRARTRIELGPGSSGTSPDVTIHVAPCRRARLALTRRGSPSWVTSTWASLRSVADSSVASTAIEPCSVVAGAARSTTRGGRRYATTVSSAVHSAPPLVAQPDPQVVLPGLERHLGRHRQRRPLAAPRRGGVVDDPGRDTFGRSRPPNSRGRRP